MKAKKILSLVIAVALVFSFSVTAFAEEDNVILNNAFYIEMPDDFENYSIYVEDYYNYMSEENYDEIYISVQENTTIDNMQEDLAVAELIFNDLLQNAYYFIDDLTFTNKTVDQVNKCSVALFEATLENTEYYDLTEYFKGYVFANQSYVYCVIGISFENNMNWFDKVVKTFRMNGTLLVGDNQKNDIDFTGAIDYKEQLANYTAEYDAFEDEDFLVIFIVMAAIFVIPLLIVIIIAVLFIIKYTKNKKVLTQYEKTFGLLPSDMLMNSNYMNYQNMQNNYSYNPQQPQTFAGGQQPVNPNYQNQNGNFNNNQNM